MQDPRKEGETLLSEGKYSDALNLFLSIPEHEKNPELFALIAHCYYKQKKFLKAFKELKKIPKELLDTESYKEAKKELKWIKQFILMTG